MREAFIREERGRKDSWKSIFDSVIMSLCSALWIPTLWTFPVIRVLRFFPYFALAREEITTQQKPPNKFTWFLVFRRKKNPPTKAHYRPSLSAFLKSALLKVIIRISPAVLFIFFQDDLRAVTAENIPPDSAVNLHRFASNTMSALNLFFFFPLQITSIFMNSNAFVVIRVV